MQAHHQKVKQQLQKRSAAGNLRRLPTTLPGVDFYSNDYLGLARLALPPVPTLEGAAEADQRRNGATGSRLLSGNSAEAETLERFLAGFFESEATLLYNSGYLANLGLLSALPGRGDTVLYDELAHACIKEGIRLSPASRYSFKHNNLQDLEARLQKASGLSWIVVESIYSMDGDQAPLQELLQLSNRYGAAVIVDEAHSTGISGRGGRGLCQEIGLADQVFARVHTFGKAMGCHGAIVAGSQDLKDYLVNFSRALIYTTAQPPHALQSISRSFNYLLGHSKLIGDLHATIATFREQLAAYFPGARGDCWVDSTSPIQAMIIPGNDQVRAVAEALQEQLLLVKPILSPTVRAGEERLRICLHTYNQPAEMEKLLQTLARLST